MTLRLPDDTKRARIVHQLAGPVERLRRAAMRRSYVVASGLTIEDWNPSVAEMMKSCPACSRVARRLRSSSSQIRR